LYQAPVQHPSRTDIALALTKEALGTIPPLCGKLKSRAHYWMH
jgi:hypothetical protein